MYFLGKINKRDALFRFPHRPLGLYLMFPGPVNLLALLASVNLLAVLAAVNLLDLLAAIRCVQAAPLKI